MTGETRAAARRGPAVTWLTSRYPSPYDGISGIFHRTQAQALVGLGASIRISAPIPWAPWPLPLLSDSWRSYARAPRRQTDGAIEVRRPRYVSVPGEPSWARMDRLVAEASLRDRGMYEGAELIHAHFATPNGMAARRIAARLGLPYVLTVHGYDLNTWPDRHPEQLASLRAALRGARCVLAVSDALRDRVREIAAVDAVSLPLGVNVAQLRSWRLPRADARRRLGLPIDAFIVLFAARLREHKGIRQFADAILADEGSASAPAVPPRTLAVVVGDGPLQGYRAAEGAARGTLLYRGGQPTETLVAYMSAADVQILPSFSEGLPTVLVEAGAVGVPVIGSRAGGIPQLIGDDRGIILPEVTTPAIRAALRDASDAAAAAARSRRLTEHVASHYDVQMNAERLLEVYREAIGRPGRRVTTVQPEA